MLFSFDLSDKGKKSLWDAVLNALDNGQCFHLSKALLSNGTSVLTTGALVRAGDRPDVVQAFTLMDKETGKLHVITMTDVYTAWWAITTRQKVNGQHHCHGSYASRIASLGFQPEECPTDAYDDDILLQVAVFKQVVYG